MDLDITHAGAASVITVGGDVDANSGYSLYLATVGEAERGSSQVVLDLAGVTFVDSVGLGMLVRCGDELGRQYESSLVLRHPSPRLLSLLELTALTTAFVIET